MNNRYAANCKSCNKRLAAGEGICQRENNRWVVFCASSCNVVAEPIVVAEPVVATVKTNRRAARDTDTQAWIDMANGAIDPVIAAAGEKLAEQRIANIKIGEPDTLSDKARKWAKQIQRRLVAELFLALDAAKDRASNNADLSLLIDSMTDRATEFVGFRHSASFWIDCRNNKITVQNIMLYATEGVDCTAQPNDFLAVIFSARAMEYCRADVAAKKEIEAERVAQEAARRKEILSKMTINGGLGLTLQTAAKMSSAYATTETRVFTLQNNQTGNAYTYVTSARNGTHLVYVANERGKSSAIFCGFLDSDLNFAIASNCVLPAHSKRLRALVWLFSHVSTNTQISQNVEILNENITAACNADGCKFTSWPAPAAVVAEYDELGEEISYDTLYH